MSVSLEAVLHIVPANSPPNGKELLLFVPGHAAGKARGHVRVYAFMRRSDDIADDAANPVVALDGLRRWREEVDAALNNGDASEPILPALVDTVRRYRIPQRHFHELLDGDGDGPDDHPLRHI
jgi:phytoene/squalene synthetase